VVEAEKIEKQKEETEILPEIPEEIKERIKSMKSVDVNKVLLHYQNLYAKVVELQRQVDHWKTQYILAEETIRHLNAELLGVLEAKYNVKEMAVEYTLTFATLHYELEEAIKKFQRSRFYIPWSHIVGLSAVLGPLLMFYFMRDWFANPQNQFFFLLIMSIVFLIAYYSRPSRR
jgi:hypothetical protein